MFALLFSTLALFAFFHAVFFIAWWREDNSVADVAWGLGFIVVTLVSFLQLPSVSDRPILALGMVALWGLRLATHIWWRNLGRGEDARYAAWRKDWGKNQLLNSYTRVFLLQGLLLLVVAAPLHLIQVTTHQPPLGWLDFLGMTVWAVGLACEAIADFQLVQFKRRQKASSSVLQTGLWRYSRHPNYFGEILVWWGFGLMALSVPFGWLGLIGPLVITFLLTKVSGIPLLEKRYAKDPAYQKYARKTSVLIPWFPG